MKRHLSFRLFSVKEPVGKNSRMHSSKNGERGNFVFRFFFGFIRSSDHPSPTYPFQFDVFLIRLEVFLKLLLCTFVLHVCASFWSSFLFLKPNFFLLHDGELKKTPSLQSKTPSYIRRQYVRLFISLNPNPSHFLILSSLLDWQPYLLCGFPGFRDSSRETRSHSTRTLQTSNNILPNLKP